MTGLQWMCILKLSQVLEAMNEVLAHDLDVCHVISDGKHVLPDGLHFMQNLWNAMKSD